MRLVKVYDADGKHVDSFNKDIVKQHRVNHNAKIRILNANGFYVKGQTTSKGVKIK